MTLLGILVQWDGSMRVYVILTPDYMGKVCGLCGNFDKNAANDQKARSGQIEDNVIAFANSWHADPNCPDISPPIDPCEATPMRQSWARYSCMYLKSTLFEPCHGVVSIFG